MDFGGFRCGPMAEPPAPAQRQNGPRPPAGAGWMFSADALREARAFSRLRTAKPPKTRLGLDATLTQRHQFQDGREQNHAMA